MRPALLALGIAVAGCTHVPPGQLVGISVAPVPNSCLEPLVGADTLILITNASGQKVAFRTYGAAGPPFKLYPGFFQVLAAAPPARDFSPWQVVLDEFVPPSHEVTLGPGDRAEFVLSPSQWPTSNNQEEFKLEVRDANYQPHLSEALRVCST